MKDHSTKIFQDMVNALGAYVQALFVNAPCHHHHYYHPVGGGGPGMGPGAGVAPVAPAGGGGGGGATASLAQPPQAAFLYRGVWMPLLPHKCCKLGELV
ncbi:hypothetical protein HPB47_013564 [Ixodes persulcatus]|uniref:Uncharacterized protein n=1 Tax=Ixodes persulcatus TaxID=34615 RepID=A0AC60R373_IXOPE|nr:hypothetical protein HPB47_013564 [Ixodes persulcatus]